jgi:hypothetical protein
MFCQLDSAYLNLDFELTFLPFNSTFILVHRAVVLTALLSQLNPNLGEYCAVVEADQTVVHGRWMTRYAACLHQPAPLA